MHRPPVVQHLFVLALGVRLVHLKRAVPVLLRGLKLLALVVEAHHARSGRGRNRALRRADRARLSALHQVLLGHELGVAAQQDIRAAAGHVGGNRHHAQPSGLGHDLRLALVIFRIQHHVLDALALQYLRKQLALLDRRGAHQHRLLRLVQPQDLVRSREILLLRGAVDHVLILLAPHRLVGRNHHNVELVGGIELRRFGLRRAGHAGQFFVHAEVVLEGDRRERLVLAPDVHAFLGLHRLVQTVGPAASRHGTAGKGVDDDHLAVLHHILHVLAIERVRLDRGLDMVLEVPVLRVGDIADAEQALNLLPALIASR